MSDDLVKRLRNSKGWPTLGNAAADRIEELKDVIDHQHKRAETLAEGWRIADDARIELEAKLAKAVDALRKLNIGQSAMPDHWEYRKHAREIARTTIAELKGGKDE